MGQIIFIGDEVTAAGFRLAGIVCHSPKRDELPELLAAQRTVCEFIVITAEYAGWLGNDVVEDMALSSRPLVAILPDIRNQVIPPDLERTVRRELGIEA